jgi:hypothetical protein
MNLNELINSAQQLDAVKTDASRPELEIIMQPSVGKKPGVNVNEFMNVYSILSKEAKRKPVELIVDKFILSKRDFSHSKVTGSRSFYRQKNLLKALLKLKSLRLMIMCALKFAMYLQIGRRLKVGR